MSVTTTNGGGSSPEIMGDHDEVAQTTAITSPAQSAGDFSIRTPEFGEHTLGLFHALGASSLDPNEAYAQLHTVEEPSEAERKLYLPSPGMIIEEKQKKLEGDVTVDIGSYFSERAWAKIGVYKSEHFDAKAPKPLVIMTTPLFVSADGHMEEVARRMAEKDFLVLVKGPPRYYKATDKTIGLVEDANEMFGLVDALEQSGEVGEISEMVFYGESQSAMKVLAMHAVKGYYGRESAASLAVALCFLRAMNWKAPHRNLARGIGMLTSGIRAVRNTQLSDISKHRGTFRRRDFRHHFGVVPILIGNEMNEVRQLVGMDEEFESFLFGRDGFSHAYQVKDDLETSFPKAKVEVDPKYGHVDGIKSPETRQKQDDMLLRVARRFDLRYAA